MLFHTRAMSYASAALFFLQLAAAATIPRSHGTDGCRKTGVVILGAGTAGITAAQALANQSISDFVIVEYNDYIGGRMAHTTFGKKPDGSPYVIELGANWVQGLGTKGGPENPIWTFTKKYNVDNTFSDYTSLLTYNENGYKDYFHLIREYNKYYRTAEQNAGVMLKDNLQDPNARAGFGLAGWKPKTMEMQAAEWWLWDWETSQTPEESSFVFGITGYNLTFYQYSAANNFVIDQGGFNTWLRGEAYTFLEPNDPRLMLNTIVSNISYSDTGVTVHNQDGSCVSAAYAVCTFSLGVLQHDVVSFSPALPDWKQKAIEMFQMGTYTKIFMQFPRTFWPADTQFFLYASPTMRGYYPVFQSLSTPGFLPGSHILFVTVVGRESYRVERQSTEQTQREVMAVLREMFPDVDVPDPTDFMLPRWTTEPWAYGSYSNWPPGTTLEMHQNLRANVRRLFFAGEATSAEYYGFLHGAWFEGRNAGERIAGLLGGGGTCASTPKGKAGREKHYPMLHGTTRFNEFKPYNGWDVSSFVTYGF